MNFTPTCLAHEHFQERFRRVRRGVWFGCVGTPQRLLSRNPPWDIGSSRSRRVHKPPTSVGCSPTGQRMLTGQEAMQAPQKVHRSGRITCVIRLPKSFGFSSIIDRLIVSFFVHERSGINEEMAFVCFPVLRYRRPRFTNLGPTAWNIRWLLRSLYQCRTTRNEPFRSQTGMMHSGNVHVMCFNGSRRVNASDSTILQRPR